ncbi:uncharacterized protein [Apostichopus japonicus]|uniref:uncharacterized protein isoform X2 n=1 Tax=Stichopus japonicus TaxID=307972 RepID=UPI003AB4C5FE
MGILPSLMLMCVVWRDVLATFNTTDFVNHGCYDDGNTSDTKILQGVGRYHPYINATGCLEFCLKEGYLLVGISYGCRICYCGELDTNYTMYGRKPDSSCEQNTECHVEPALRIYQVPCPVLSLTNGRVSYKEMTAVFECDGGRSLIGEQKLQCINDNGSIIWDKEQPRCIVESTLPTSSAEISFTTLPYLNLRSPILESTTFNEFGNTLSGTNAANSFPILPVMISCLIAVMLAILVLVQDPFNED